MEIIYILIVLAVLAIGFGLGERSNRRERDRLQISLCDAYGSIDEVNQKYKRVKANYWKLAREHVELSNANKLMRKANEEIAKESYDDGYKDGLQAGKIAHIKEITDEMVCDREENGSIAITA